MGRGKGRKEESEESLPQLPPFVICELVHQLGHIVKTYPKTRVNLDLQLFSKLSHSRCTLPSHCVMCAQQAGAFGPQHSSELRI